MIDLISYSVFFLGYTFISISGIILICIIMSPFHEKIHYLIANRYVKCGGKIESWCNVYKRLNVRFVKIPYFKNGRGFHGQTTLDNNYLVYSNAQIRVIAIVPSIVDFFIMAFYEIAISVLFTGYLDRLEVLSSFISMLIVLIIIQFIVPIMDRTDWNDMKIFRDPEGFKEHIEHKEQTLKPDRTELKKEAEEFIEIIRKRRTSDIYSQDLDFTKVTPKEKKELERIEKDMDNGVFFTEDDVWD